jgi:hypothetical protein
MTLASVLCPEGHLLVANKHSYASAWSYKTGKRMESSFEPRKRRNSPPMGAYFLQIFFARFARAGRERGKEGGREGRKEGGRKERREEKKEEGRKKKKFTLRSVLKSI